MGLVNLGFHFGHVPMRFVEVAYVSTGFNPCIAHVPHSHECHSGAPNFPELRDYFRPPFSLVKLGFHFGRVLMRFVEVACVSTSLTPCFAHVPHSHECHSRAPDFSELCVYAQTPLGPVKLGFHFGRVLMRLVEMAGVSTSLTRCFAHVPYSHACHSGAHDFRKLCVYSRTPMGLPWV